MLRLRTKSLLLLQRHPSGDNSNHNDSLEEVRIFPEKHDPDRFSSVAEELICSRNRWSRWGNGPLLSLELPLAGKWTVHCQWVHAQPAGDL